ncbi:hypothetical protein PMIN06_007959 [Paraphaeosphaeria minitans]
MHLIKLPPFSVHEELVHPQAHLHTKQTFCVPNEPFIPPSDVQAFLCRELECTILDELAPSFFIFCKRRSSHVNTLHEYISTGSHVIVSEDPGLHLVRKYNVIFIKPVPHCLFNFDFWVSYLVPRQDGSGVVGYDLYDPARLKSSTRSALGLLRSYGYLIKHESDFLVARSNNLVPGDVSYTQFQYFIHPFRELPDFVVSPRYEYGHIRMTRLNLATRILRPRSTGKIFPWSYHKLYYHSGQYLAKFAAPLLFLFASFTLILSSMQVGLAAKETYVDGVWDAFGAVSYVFSICTLCIIVTIGAFVVLGVGTYVLNRVIIGCLVNRKWKARSQSSRDTENEAG